MKPYCTGKQAVAAVAAFQNLLADGLDPAAAAAIEVFVPKRYAAMIDRPVNRGGRQSGSTFGNVRYQFGLAAYHPEVLFDAARTEIITDPRLYDLAEKVTIKVDETLADALPRVWPARVEVETAAGRLARTVTAAPGDPDRRLDDAATLAKFHALTDRLVGRAEADDWAEAAAGALSSPAGLERLAAKFEALYA
jgi:2-methylcitrate dehydratase PrpD